MSSLTHRSLTVTAGLPVLVTLLGYGSCAGISTLGKTADRELIVGEPVAARVLIGEAAPHSVNLGLVFQCRTACHIAVDFEDPALEDYVHGEEAGTTLRSSTPLDDTCVPGEDCEVHFQLELLDGGAPDAMETVQVRVADHYTTPTPNGCEPEPPDHTQSDTIEITFVAR